MAAVLTLLILGFISFVTLNILFSDDKFATALTIAGIVLVVFFIGVLSEEHIINKGMNKHNTEIINNYKSRNYSLELKVDGDKIDTLYIFK